VIATDPIAMLLLTFALTVTLLILSGLREQPKAILRQMGVDAPGATLRMTSDFREAISLARDYLATPPEAH
jgi:hypothetical protein